MGSNVGWTTAQLLALIDDVEANTADIKLDPHKLSSHLFSLSIGEAATRLNKELEQAAEREARRKAWFPVWLRDRRNF